MKRVGVNRSLDEQIEYHTNRNDAPEFDVGQPYRVALARFLIDKIIAAGVPLTPLRIVELGCGAGDISGPYSRKRYVLPEYAPAEAGKEISTTARVIQHNVTGVDVVPVAGEKIARRFPDMEAIIARVEEVEPIDCDILVMTEFLEHVAEPEIVVRNWLPRAKWAVVGHPLDEPDPPFEPGHIWSYTREDWRSWFAQNGHQWQEEYRFPMGPWDAMILGCSKRVIHR